MPVTESLITYLEEVKQQAKDLKPSEQNQILRKIKPLTLNSNFSEKQILENARTIPKLVFALGGVSVNLILI